jgi:hypothetical protein
MIPWRFQDYVTEDGHNLIQEWYEVQDVSVQVAFDTTLLLLRSVDDWLDPKVKEFKELDKQHLGLGELRFHISVLNQTNKRTYRRRFRPPGIWRPKNRDFIILLGCEKQGMTYTPHGAFDLALNYKAAFEQGRGTIREHF